MYNANVHNQAILGVLPQLNLFEPPIVQSGVERSMFIEYRPTSQISSQDAPIHFSLGGDSGHYLDFKRTRLYVKLKIVKEDNTDLGEDDIVAPINYTLHSLFSQVEIKVSGKVVSVSNNCYPYKAYFQALLKSTSDAKASHMTAQMFRQDDGDLDKVTANTGAVWRGQRFAKSNSVECEGSIHEDFCETNRYILNNTQIDIKFFRSRQPFVLLTETDNKYKMVIEDVSLKACYVDVHPGIIQGHHSAIQEVNAIYPYTRVEMLTFNISKGSLQFNLDNLFNTQCPTKVLVGFVESDSFSGDFKKNPFNFKHFDLLDIELSLDGQSVPSRAIKVASFEKLGSQVISPYMRLFDTIGASDNSSFGNGIDPEDFSKGFAIYAFPLYGGGIDNNFMQMKRNANIRIQGSFNKALENAITAVIYAEFPAVLELQASRNVIIN